MKALTREEFISRSTKIHRGKYIYEKSIYSGRNKLVITCRRHGDFLQLPHSHLAGYGCRLCKTPVYTKDLLIKTGEKYGYKCIDLKESYKANEYVTVNCLIHGYFKQKVRYYVSGRKCTKCENESRRTPEDVFLEKCKKIHNNYYDYSKATYINSYTKITIICPRHGEFQQTTKNHLTGQKCPKCRWQDVYTTSAFIKRSAIVHNNKFDYSKTKYVDSHAPVEIICSRHGSFIQSPSQHLHNKAGCPKCHASKGELEIIKILDSKNIRYVHQYRINRYAFDFYLPNYGILIEYDGIQHFQDVKYFKNIPLKRRQERDHHKNNLALIMDINLIRIPYWRFNDIENILNRYI